MRVLLRKIEQSRASEGGIDNQAAMAAEPSSGSHLRVLVGTAELGDLGIVADFAVTHLNASTPGRVMLTLALSWGRPRA